MSIISDVKDRITDKFEEKAEINQAKKDMKEEVRDEYIRGMKEQKLKNAYQKGIDSVNKKRTGIFGGIVKPFTPEELKSMVGQNTMNQNNTTQNTSANLISSSFTQPIIMTKEMEAINKLREGK